MFNDTAAEPVRQALGDHSMDWIATDTMRSELARVLAYPKLATRLAFYQLRADDVLAKFDQHARLVGVAPKAAVTCSDADDQMFIDLAAQHQSLLLSKDTDILCMKKRLLTLGIRAQAAL